MSEDETIAVDQTVLIGKARAASASAYAPYSNFPVGAALAFSDGRVFTGSNVENASLGLSLCAETVAAASAMNAGARGGLTAIAVAGGPGGNVGPVTPCGRCRQFLSELAQLGSTDPIVWCVGEDSLLEARLSSLLPQAFGPANLA